MKIPRRCPLKHMLTCGAAVLAWLPLGAFAQEAPAASSGIYTCINAAGRKLTSDRPIPECHDRDQRVLNSDGSLRTVLQPPMTAEERAAAEEAERARVQERASRNEAVRRDRNLLARYPNEAAHAKAREAALQAAQNGVLASEKRVVELQKERKPLIDEAEFYQGKPMPPKLKAQIESVDVSIEAQRALVENQKIEVKRVNALYDIELERLRRLWGGAPPGSLGPPPQAAEKAAERPAMPASASKPRR